MQPVDSAALLQLSARIIPSCVQEIARLDLQPCSEAGGFICAGEDPSGERCNALLRTPAAAYDHINRRNCPYLRKSLPPASKDSKPLREDWVDAFAFLRAQTQAAGLAGTNYDAWEGGEKRFAPVPGREITPDGFACTSCGAGFKEERAGVRHLEETEHLAIFPSQVMRLSGRKSVPVTAEPRRFAERFEAFNQAFAALLRRPHGDQSSREADESPATAAAAAAAAGAAATDRRVLLVSELRSRLRQPPVDGNSSVPSKPAYLGQLHFFQRQLSSSEQASIWALCAPVPRPANRPNAPLTVDQRLKEVFFRFLRDIVTKKARHAGLEASSKVVKSRLMVAQQGSTMEKYQKEFSFLEAATEAKYADVMSDALMFAMRLHLSSDFKPAHQWKEFCMKNTRERFEKLLTLLPAELPSVGEGTGSSSLPMDISRAADVGCTTWLSQELEILLGDLCLCLFTEASGSEPLELSSSSSSSSSGGGGGGSSTGSTAPATTQHPAMMASDNAPTLATYVCCSLLQHSDNPEKLVLSDAQRCRKLCPPLVYFGHCLVLYRTDQRKSGTIDLPEPFRRDPSGASMRSAVLYDGAACLEIIHMVAGVSRYWAKEEYEQGKFFKTLPDGGRGVEFSESVVYDELLPLARKHSREDLAKAIAALGPLYRGTIQGISNQDRKLPLTFQGEGGKVRDVDLANSLLLREDERIAPELPTLLKRVVDAVFLAIYADALQGARVSEYIGLLAQPRQGMLRDISLTVTTPQRVQVHVKSKKNGMSDVITLSQELSPLIITYLATLRPCIPQLRKPLPLDEAEWDSLLPGLKKDTARRLVTALYSKLNLECEMLRRQCNFLPQADSSLNNIGPRVVRQLVHVVISTAVPKHWWKRLDLLRDMIDNLSGTELFERLRDSSTWLLLLKGCVMPKLLGPLALHSSHTAATTYGRSTELPNLERERSESARDFVREIIDLYGQEAVLAVKKKNGLAPTGSSSSISSGIGSIGSSRSSSSSSESVRASSKQRAADVDTDDTQAAAKRSRLHEQGAMAGTAASSHLPEPMVLATAPAAVQAVADVAERGSDARALQDEQCVMLLARANEAINAANTVQIDPCNLTDTVVGLRYGREPLYLSDQQEKLVHAVARGIPTVAVMPTGSGKTLAASSYMMSAMAKGPREYVIYHVPLVSLQQDLYERFTDDVRGKAGLVAIFRPERMHELLGMASTLRMLIVSSENVRHESFGSLMQAMRNQDRGLTRIFIDEAHMLLMSCTFRASFLDICLTLRGLAPATIVCMTATARPEELDSLKKLVYGAGHKQVTTVQAPCHRVNLECRVVHAPPEATDSQAMEAFAELVDGVLQNALWKDSQMIVYAREIERCSMLKEVLGKRLAARGIQVGIYHGNMGSQERESALSDFKQQKLQVMVATNALGVGVDILTVGCVLHFGIPGCSIHEFLQQIGRAARPGNKLKRNRGLSIVFSVVSEHRALLQVMGSEDRPEALLARDHGVMTPRQNAEAILEYVRLTPGLACRRVFQAEALMEKDAAKLSCKEIAGIGSVIDAARCDLCTTGNEGHNAAAVAQLDALAAQTTATSFELQLKEAELILHPGICCLCSLQHSKPLKYAERPCMHREPTHWSRCFLCGGPSGPNHRRVHCTVLKDAFGAIDGPPTKLNRCLKCHRLQLQCLNSCARSECTAMLAMTALRVLRPTIQWESFKSKLPPALLPLVEAEGEFAKWLPSTEALCVAMLKQPAGLGEDETSQYRAVHVVLVLAAQTIKR